MFQQLQSLLLPLVVAGLIPALLLRGEPSTPPPGWQAALGVGLFALGLSMLVWTISLFVRRGRGTLAPWSPPRHLVVEGPYAHVRNPMISGVIGTLTGEAAFFGSTRIALWAAAVFAVNHVYFILSEERGLAARFGAEYAAYKAQVPRWLPRWHAWRP